MDQVSEVRGAAYVHDRYRAEHGVFACLRRAMSGTDRIIRWTTAIAVLAVAAVTAVASYEHAHDLDRAHGELGWTAHMVPLTAHGLIYASSMVMLDSARRRAPVPALARWLLGDARGQRRSWSRARADGAAVAAWPAVALVGSYELLMMVIPSSQVPAAETSDGRTR
jgi:hypothetical protein